MRFWTDIERGLRSRARLGLTMGALFTLLPLGFLAHMWWMILQSIQANGGFAFAGGGFGLLATLVLASMYVPGLRLFLPSFGRLLWPQRCDVARRLRRTLGAGVRGMDGQELFHHLQNEARSGTAYGEHCVLTPHYLLLGMNALRYDRIQEFGLDHSARRGGLSLVVRYRTGKKYRRVVPGHLAADLREALQAACRRAGQGRSIPAIP